MIRLTTVIRSGVMTIAAGAMAACAVSTQIDSLRPVAGDAVAALNAAADGVLLEEGIEILVAPVCELNDEGYDCAGKTLSGEDINVVAPGSDPETMTVSVGSKTLYEGSIEDVLQKAAER